VTAGLACTGIEGSMPAASWKQIPEVNSRKVKWMYIMSLSVPALITFPCTCAPPDACFRRMQSDSALAEERLL
jgi:hypothetical protein